MAALIAAGLLGAVGACPAWSAQSGGLGAPAVAAAPGPADENGADDHAARSTPVLVQIGHATVIQAAEDIKSIVNPNPKVLSIQVQSRRSLILFGVVQGATQLGLVDSSGVRFATLDVTVAPDLAPLQALLREALGEPKITLQSVGGSMVLTGEVANAARVAQATEIAAKSVIPGGGFVNLLHSSGSDQITVAVKVLELNRSNLMNMGLKWTARNGSPTAVNHQIGNVFSSAVLGRPLDQFSFVASSTFRIDKTAVDTFVDFLRTEGDAKLLAEPTIVATSGKPAKFLAGGEIPIPVPYGYGTAQSTATTGTTTPVASTFSGLIYKKYVI